MTKQRSTTRYIADYDTTVGRLRSDVADGNLSAEDALRELRTILSEDKQLPQDTSRRETIIEVVMGNLEHGIETDELI